MLQSQVYWVSNFGNAFDLRVKHNELWVIWSKKNGRSCSKVGKNVLYFPLTFFVTIIEQFLRQNYDDAMAVLLYEDCSSSSDSSDEDMLNEIFVDAVP